MNIENIIKQLNQDGIEVEVKEVNGRESIIVGTEKIRPVLYTDIISDLVDEEALKFIRSAIAEKPSIDMDQFDKESILKNVRIGIEREHDASYLTSKTWMQGVQQYLYVNVLHDNEKFGICRIKKDFIDSLCIDQEELWKIASINTYNDTEIYDFLGMTVISNKEKHLGASAALDKNALKEFAIKNGVKKLYIVPSSIHECIILPAPYDESVLDEMIRSTNLEEVDPREQLADIHFTFEL